MKMQLTMAAIFVSGLAGGKYGPSTPISSTEYQRLYKERGDRETQGTIAAREAARSAKACGLVYIGA